MAGTWIDVTAPGAGGSPNASGGETFEAYLALPESGSGPGLVLLQEVFGVNRFMRETADYLAEEGYVVAVPDLFWRLERRVDLEYNEAGLARAFDLYGRFDSDRAVDDVLATVAALRERDDCTDGVGVLGFCLGGRLAYLAACRGDVACAVSYYGVGLDNDLGEAANLSCPMVFHFGEADTHAPPSVADKLRQTFAGRSDVEIYVYPGAGHGFANSLRAEFDKPAATMAYSRSLAVLRKTMGPDFDLAALWDEHCYHEFVTRDVKALMATMVAEPYVNVVPTVTGGVGQEELARFYQHHFCHANPADTTLVPISRTIGTDRLVDEMIFCCTHDREIDWLLPGVPPTGRYLEIPMVAIVNFRGGKLFHEHIYWDQATVLVQAGLLDAAGLPVTAVAQARKLVDENQPANEVMGDVWARSSGKPVDV